MKSGIVYSISRNKKQEILKGGLSVAARVELRKCTICHKAFGWNRSTRCICNECKKVNVAGNACGTCEKTLFIMVNHNRRNRVSA